MFGKAVMTLGIGIPMDRNFHFYYNTIQLSTYGRATCRIGIKKLRLLGGCRRERFLKGVGHFDRPF